MASAVTATCSHPGSPPTRPPAHPPTRPPAHPPPRLVRHGPRGDPHSGQDGLVVALAPPPGPQDGLADAAGRERDVEQAAERVGHLAVAEARVLVQVHGRGLGAGAELAAAAPQGVGRLEGVPALDPPATVAAPADPHVEPAAHRPAGEFDVVLAGRPGGVDAAAARAPDGERGVVGLVHPRRGGPERTVGPVRVPGLAARLLGVGLGRPLAERRRLPLAGPGGRRQRLLQGGDPGLQVRDPLGRGCTPGAGRLRQRIRRLSIHASRFYAARAGRVRIRRFSNTPGESERNW